MATYADNSILKTSGYVAKEAALGLYNKSLLLAAVDRQYAAEFGITAGGAKVGSSITIRKPAIFLTTNNVDLTVSAFTEQSIVVKLATRTGVHFDLDTQQVTLDIESEGKGYSERTLQPAGEAIGSAVESNGFKLIANTASNFSVVESAGYDVTKLKAVIAKMNASLTKQLAPRNDRWAFFSSDFEADFVAGNYTLFHSNEELEKGYKDATVSRFAGLDIGSTDLVYSRLNGAGGDAGFTVSAYTEGSNSITVTHATLIADVVVGDKLTITGCNLVNAQTKKAYVGVGVQRTVQAITAVDATHIALTIEPIWFTATDSRQNVSATPVGKSIVWLGTKGKNYVCIPVLQKSSVTFASADLYLPRNVEMAAREKAMDISLRFIRDYRIGTDDLPNRLEILGDFFAVRPEWMGIVEVGLD